MKKLPLATALITNLIIGAPDVLASAIPVTIDNYNQAVAAKSLPTQMSVSPSPS